MGVDSYFLFLEPICPRLRREQSSKPTIKNCIGSPPLKRREHIFMLTLGAVEKKARWSLISHSTQPMSAATGSRQRRRKSTPRVDRICITAFSRPRWSEAVAGIVTLNPCPEVPEPQILWCPEPATETANPARRARFSSSVVLVGMEPVGVPPEMRRMLWWSVLVRVPAGLMDTIWFLGSLARTS